MLELKKAFYNNSIFTKSTGRITVIENTGFLPRLYKELP
jgi:hypothetical protein